MRIFSAVIVSGLAIVCAVAASEDAVLIHDGAETIITANCVRPVEAIARKIGSEYGVFVGVEDPAALTPHGGPLTIRYVNDVVPAILKTLVQTANAASGFGYRLDTHGKDYFLVATRNGDEGVTPLLDRTVTIVWGPRRKFESAALMAQSLSKQTGLQVSCCQSVVNGLPWGMEEESFGATNEPARDILRRLGVIHWHVRCDNAFCFVEMQP